MRYLWLALLLLSVAFPANAQTIKPGDGQSIIALGHTWTFSTIQDDYTGYDVLKDGKATSDHGVQLSWDGATLTLTWHHPYPFDPGTGQPWQQPGPPLFTKNLFANEPTNPLNSPAQIQNPPVQMPGVPPRTENPVPGPNWPPNELQHIGYQCQIEDDLLNLTVDYLHRTVHEGIGDKQNPQRTGKPKGLRSAEMPNRNEISYDTDNQKHIQLDLAAGIIRETNMDGETIEGRCWRFD